MKKSFFDLTVSLEEDTSAIVDEAVAAGGDEPVEAADVVEAEEETAALVESQQDAEQQVATLEDAEVVADDLEDQLEEQEKIIEEKPEEVTEDTVAIAQEAMVISLTKLGMPYEEIRSYRVSLEANDSTPLQKFQVCTEGLKDVLVKVKDGIINAVKAVINQIKKIWQNASIFFDRSEKTANKLIAEYKDSSGNVVADDALVSKVNGKFGGWFLATGDYNFSNILKFAQEVKVPKGIAGKKDIVKELKGVVKTKINLDNILPADAKGKDATVVYLLGSKVTYVTDSDIISGEVSINNIDANKSKAALNKQNVAGILAYLKTAAEAAKNMKKFQTDTFAAMDDIVKNVKNAANDAKEGEGDEAKKQLALVRKIGTKFALETVNQYIGAVNGSVACCAAMLKATKKKEESK